MVKHRLKGPRALTQDTFINIYLLSSPWAAVSLSNIYSARI